MGEDDKEVLKRIAKVWHDLMEAERKNDQKEWTACFRDLRAEMNRLPIP